MSSNSPSNRISLCIALPSSPRILYKEIGDMILDVLEGSAYRARIVADGDDEALNAELLLIIGDCQAFQLYADLFNSKRKHRPVTILWMLDTLPPVSFTPQAAKIGSRLSIYNESLNFMRSYMKPVVNAIPLSVRKHLGLAVCSALLTGLDEELRRSSQEELQGLDVNSRYEVIGRSEWMRSNYESGWLDHVVANTTSKCQFLQKIGIPSEFIPFGYHTGMGEDLHLHRDIDVLFLGEIAYGRRKPILDNIRARLSEKGIDLTVNSGNCYGRERSELLSRAKISLNLPRFTWDLPTIRLFMSMGCGSMVASEYVADTTPFVSGEHFVQATADKIADKIAYYLNHDAEREAISARATKLITTDYTLEKALQRVLALYEKS